MTENEAKEMLQAKLTCMNLEDLSCIEKGCSRNCDDCEYNYAQGTSGEQEEALSVAIKALEEIQKYRAIGTVEECREAMEKQKAKKILNQCQGHEAECLCPTCRTFLGDDQDWYYDQTKYCGNCGQKLEEY